MQHDTPHHMPPAEFTSIGRALLDWLAAYPTRIQDAPVQPPTAPGDVAAKLPKHAPEDPDPDFLAHTLADLDEIVLPNLTHWQHPRFFGYFPCNSTAPAVLAELVCAGLGTQGMLWSTGPAVTEIETRVLDWMCRAFGLPDRFLASATAGGVIQGTASEGALAALVAARYRLRKTLGSEPDCVVYTSEQAHSSIAKAAVVAGVARAPDDAERCRLVPTDDQHRMDPCALDAMLREDVAAGRHPTFIAATLGTTGTGAFDPVEPIAQAVRTHAPDAWLHVDAAWAGAALVCPEHRGMLGGVEHADSVCVNPHKWLLTNFDCDLFWTSDRASLTGAMSVTPEYLRNAASDSGSVIDYRDWHVPLGRRFRALKLWFVCRWYGLSGLRAYIRQHVRLGETLETRLRADVRFDVPIARSLSLVTFRCAAGDDVTRDLMHRVNETGQAFLTHTIAPVRGKPTYLIRVAIGAVATTDADIEQLWRLLDEFAATP